MVVSVGILVTVLCVFGGYAIGGGHLLAIAQPIELLIICGAAAGAFILGNPPKNMKATLRVLPTLLRGSKFDKELYLELIGLLYTLLTKMRKEGALALEGDVDDPASSSSFRQFQKVLADPHIVEFICDYLRLIIGGNMNAFEIESLMDEEIETYHEEQEVPVHALTRIGDGMPAFGIVAAVMGVVHTLEMADQPPAVLGAMIARALVGTFMGILLSYGLVGPLASVVQQRAAESSKVFQCIKVTLLASLNGYAPTIAVEFGRKVLFSTERPTFVELDQLMRKMKGK